MEASSPVIRLFPLDALRGFAAVAVLLWHYRTGFGAAPMPTLLAPFYSSGGYAVPFFFLLSGYVLSHVYLAPSRRPYFARNLLARFARMAPLHYATLILVACIQLLFVAREGKPFLYQFNDGWHFLLNLTFLQESGLQTSYSFNGPSWSISVEMLVNTLFLILIAGRKLVTPAFLAIVCVSTALLLAAGGDILYSAAEPVLDRLMLGGFAGFFWGAVLYRMAPPGQPKSLLFDAIFATTLVITLTMLRVRPDMPQAHFDLVLTFIAFPALVVSALRGVVASWLLSLSALRWLGYISFSLYLIQFPVQCAFHAVQFHFGFQYQSRFVFAAFVFCSLAAGYLVARNFEWPVYKLLTGRHLYPR
jgi:peptidoglycan/LPS O-acetylase OafA/YrhL